MYAKRLSCTLRPWPSAHDKIDPRPCGARIFSMLSFDRLECERHRGACGTPTARHRVQDDPLGAKITPVFPFRSSCHDAPRACRRHIIGSRYNITPAVAYAAEPRREEQSEHKHYPILYMIMGRLSRANLRFAQFMRQKVNKKLIIRQYVELLDK